MSKAGKKAVRSRNIIGARVREARLRAIPPITQDQLSGRLAADAVQLDRVAIAKIEHGMRCAFDFEVKALAIILQVDVRWLLGMPETHETNRTRKRKT